MENCYDTGTRRLTFGPYANQDALLIATFCSLTTPHRAKPYSFTNALSDYRPVPDITLLQVISIYAAQSTKVEMTYLGSTPERHTFASVQATHDTDSWTRAIFSRTSGIDTLNETGRKSVRLRFYRESLIFCTHL